MSSFDFACVGTYIKSRKNTPNFDDKKMIRGETYFMTNNNGILATKWKDTKDVFAMSNYHQPTEGLAKRKMKNGQKK